MSISKDTLSFLTNLAQNNNRDWFTNNKSTYIEAHENIILFADKLLSELEPFDKIETYNGKKAVKRIYRDVRFSKNKSPYKNNFGIQLTRSGDDRRGGFFIHIQPNHTFVVGGFWQPDKDDLLRIRKHIEVDDSDLREVINSSYFKHTFGELQGSQLKLAPKGFDKESPAIDLLRYKQYLVSTSFTNEQVCADNFAAITANTLKSMLPFLDVMTEMLTTDLNGATLT